MRVTGRQQQRSDDQAENMSHTAPRMAMMTKIPTMVAASAKDSTRAL